MDNKESFEKAIADIKPGTEFRGATQKLKAYDLMAALTRAGIKFDKGDTGFENQ